MNTVMRASNNNENTQISGAKEYGVVDTLVWGCEAISASRMQRAKTQAQRDHWDQKMPFLTFRDTDTNGSTTGQKSLQIHATMQMLSSALSNGGNHPKSLAGTDLG